MADEKPEAIVEAPVVAPEVIPVAPVAEAPSEAVADVAPAAEQPAVEAPVAEVVEKLPTEEPTLLEAFDADKAKAEEPKKDEPKSEEKPAEEKKPEEKKSDEKPEDKKDEEKPVEAAKPESVEYKYEVPEDLKISDEQKGKFNTALDLLRADPQKGSQELINMHREAMQEHNKALERYQHEFFAKTREGWRKEVMADPEIGGSGYQTSMQAIARMRDMFVSRDPTTSKEYQASMKSFGDFLHVTGAGDHPAFLRFVHNVAQAFDEPGMAATTGIKPVKNGGHTGKGGGLYKHPNSPQAGES